jgi:hypothetical protein
MKCQLLLKKQEKETGKAQHAENRVEAHYFNRNKKDCGESDRRGVFDKEPD